MASSIFTKAVREKVALKIAITGPSGSGKTYSALQMAFGLADGGKVAVLDTENGSANLYADLGEYDTVTLSPPFTTARYMEIIRAAQREGYSVLVIDSLTHLWAGDGGLLQQKEAKDARGGNSYTNWAEITRFFEQFKSAMLQSPMHVIATIRSKQEYVVEADQRGKQVPRKVGMAPIMRDGIEYEFTTVFDVDMSHSASVSKDRTKLFDGRYFQITPQTGKELVDWLATGAVPSEPTRAETNEATENRVAAEARWSEPARLNNGKPQDAEYSEVPPPAKPQPDLPVEIDVVVFRTDAETGGQGWTVLCSNTEVPYKYPGNKTVTKRPVTLLYPGAFKAEDFGIELAESGHGYFRAPVAMRCTAAYQGGTKLGKPAWIVQRGKDGLPIIAVATEEDAR